MISAGLALLLCLFPVQETGTQAPAIDVPSVIAPALTANTDNPSGVLRFSIKEPTGRLIPGRLTFVQEGRESPELFPGVDARPNNLAVRLNVVYCLSGEDAITVPVGKYSVYATRGIEWSQVIESIEIKAGEEHAFNPVLTHEVSSSGWISGDFHLHTLTHSGHGDSNLKERVISLIGEGVEFAVATDHNHNTDYHPTMEELEVDEEMSSVTGNEISTPLGHFNAFPLDPDSEVIDSSLTDARELFRLIREQTNEHGVTPVIQLNHPRWAGIDFFTEIGLDPVTGRTNDGEWAADFDTLELLNENEGWGFHDADVAGDLPVGSSIHSVLQDWYNLLNLGYQYYAVGNSDSHTVHSAFAGYPRNYVQSSTDRPSEIKPAEIANALRQGRSFISTGPFIRVEVNGQGPGEVVQSTQHNVAVIIDIEAPSWMYLSRAKVIVNGDVHNTILLEPHVLESGAVQWPTAKAVIRVHRDSWVHVIVEGDEGIEPIASGDRPILPLAISNPIWIQSDSEAEQTSTWTWAVGECATRKSLEGLRPNEAAFVLHAAADQRSNTLPDLVRSGLSYGDRLVQLAALRAIEKRKLRGLDPVLLATFTRAGDTYLALAICRALKATGANGSLERLVELFEKYGSDQVMRYSHELDALIEGEAIRSWMVAGHFENSEAKNLFNGEYGPELEFDANGQWQGKAGMTGWQAREASESGYLDLSGIDGATAPASVSFAQTWLHAAEDVEALYAMGSDDGCRLWLAGEEVYRDTTQHGATPLQKIGRLPLKAGWNRVVIGVENGGGPSGLYFRVMSPGIKSATSPQ